MAVVLDGFRIFVLKHELQSVADSAALAGASAVQGKIVFDPVTGTPIGERLELDPNTADIYATQLLSQNITAHNFSGQGITNVQTIDKGAIDADVDGTLDGYYIKLSAEIESLIYGQLTGKGKTLKITREAEAKCEK